MGKIGYYYAKLKYRILGHNYEYINNYFRKYGMKIGNNSKICGMLSVTEPNMVEIKDDCVISSDVLMITHDHSISKVSKKSNLFGKIIIGNNCFIGQRSIIMYGVELSDNIIVASGSVVTKSFFEKNIISGGNPAKKIGDWSTFKEKYNDKAMNRDEFNSMNNQDKLIRR